MSVPNLPSVCQQLWELDDNRLVPRRDYEINLQVIQPLVKNQVNLEEDVYANAHTHTPQAGKNFSDKSDHASDPLIKYINESGMCWIGRVLCVCGNHQRFPPHCTIQSGSAVHTVHIVCCLTTTNGKRGPWNM